MKKILFFASFLISIGLMSCETIIGDDIACTDHIETLQIYLLDSQNTPVILDSTKVTRLSDNSTFDFQVDEFPDMGIYYYLTDEYFEQVSQNGEEVLFEGFKDSLSISQMYQVKQGMCHVEKISGPDTLRYE